MIVLVMGVEGSGKSTVGRALAGLLRWEFAEGDDFHPAANKAKMHAGISLTDADRAPWLTALHEQIVVWQAKGTNAVLAASALREQYRRLLFAEVPTAEYRIVYLWGPAPLLRQRVDERAGHFASPAILADQIAILEPPGDAVAISIAQPLPAQLREIRIAMGLEQLC